MEYSSPNVAKEMHVGHLRSTVIGDALVRILEFDAAKVIRHNHIGDWGTQFGMLIQFMQEEPEGQLSVGQGESGEEAISRLDALYRASRKKFDSDPEFADRARKRVVALQAGDPETVAGWQDIVAESKIYFGAGSTDQLGGHAHRRGRDRRELLQPFPPGGLRRPGGAGHRRPQRRGVVRVLRRHPRA